MFRALLRSRLEALFAMWFRFGGRRTGAAKKRSPVFKILIGILVVYVVACFIFLFATMFVSMLPLCESGLTWFYFAIAGITAFALSFIGSLFTAQQQLYNSKDNDLLLAMPVPPSYILASRMLTLLFLNFIMGLFVLVPAGVVYCVAYAPNAAGIAFFALLCLIIPFLSLTFSCVLGFLITLVTNRMRSKTLVTTVLSLAFLGAYFYVFANINKYLGALISGGAEIAAAVKRAVYPAWAFGKAIADGDLAAFLGFSACALVPFALLYLLMSRTFLRMTTMKNTASKIKYRERKMKRSGVSAALTGKELKHFFSNGMYMMNAALGSFMLLIGAVAVLFYRGLPELVGSVFPKESGLQGALAALVICFVASTNVVSAPSVSLEGRNLWIVKSMPVGAYDALMAKVKCHVIIAVPPALLASFTVSAVFGFGFMSILAVFLAPLALNIFCAFLGVVVNLHFPRFDFINEVAVVKQGVSTIICMLASMGAVGLPLLVYALLPSGVIGADIFTLCFAAVYFAAAAGMCAYLRGGGARRFEEL